MRAGLALLVAIFSPGCATSTGAPAGPATSAPTSRMPQFEAGWSEEFVIAQVDPSLRASFEQELEPFQTREVLFAGDEMRLSGEASGPLVVQDIGDGIYEVNFPLGEEAEEMNCFVYPDITELGTLVHAMYDEVALEVERMVTVGVRSGVENGRPFIMADAYYRYIEAGETTVGVVRIAAGSAWASTLMCLLDMPGMRRSFERMFREALGSLQSSYTQLPDNLRYHEVYLLDGGDLVTGFVENVVLDTDSDETQFAQYTSRLYRLKKMDLGAFDSSVSEESARGRVRSLTTNALMDGEVQYSLAVASTPDAPFHYLVEGEAFGDPISSSFDVDGGLEDQAMRDARVAQLLRTEGARGDGFLVFDPGRNPRSATRGNITRLTPPKSGYNVAYSFPEDGQEYLAQVNADGRTIKAEYEFLEGLPIRMKQVYADGEID